MKRLMLAVSVAAFALAGRAEAASISYEAIDLGAGQWQYSYNLSGFTPIVEQGFTIYFDPLLYENLNTPTTAAPADWEVYVFQPDLTLNSEGLFDAFSLNGAPANGNPFTVKFGFLGAGAPGAQRFEIYKVGPFEIIETGNTTPALSTVPEPASLILLATGGAMLARARRRRR